MLKHFKSHYLSLCVLMMLLTSCASTKIIDRPIVFNEEREQLTKEYLMERYGFENPAITIVPKMIVLHWTAIPTLEGSFDVFNDPTLPNWRTDVENASGLNVSSHFLVAQDGTIYRLMPETVMGRHVIGLNHCAIGIENVGGTEETPLTEAQLKANIWLVNYISEKYNIDYLIGHYEYPLFEGHELWLEKDDEYRTEKTDPGEEFMANVRKATTKFKFKSVPQ
ncbi:peptidoglycan recognition family protein [uncultured Muriicola sp.]|uniref:N-acetylmuramoyl-L-alanine amidase n=1 Tax=uncultured Muriicola sp. TaxID=1583102 RepID=UPI0026358647|nr:peptidoglycan recognition family protein [uncultured Muriicola sp.]